MAYVCLLLEENGFSEIGQVGRSYLVKIDVGYDDDLGLSHILFVTLDVSAGGYHELSFCIIEKDYETGIYSDIYSGLETKSSIPPEARQKIMEHLCGSIRALIADARPERFFMCMCDFPLPHKAQIKFERICFVAATCGYTVEEIVKSDGQKSWWMERAIPANN